MTNTAIAVNSPIPRLRYFRRSRSLILGRLPGGQASGAGSDAILTAVERERLHWVDVAKASAVVLVVLYHVAITGMSVLTVGSNRVEAVLAAFSAWLLPVRMPLFFLVSGLLSVGALSRGWGAIARPRILDHAWVFALWTLLYAYPYAAAYNPQHLEATAVRAASWVVSLNGAYWYLPLLALFFVVSRLGRRVPLVMLALAAAAYVLWPWVPLVGEGIVFDALFTLRRFLNFYLFFALGAFARPLVERWAKVPWWVLPLTVAAYVPIALEIYAPQRSEYRQPLTAVLSILGITFFLGASRLLATVGAVRRLGSYLAARTLPIYIFHPLLLALLIWLTPGFGKQGSLVSIWLVPLLVVLLTGAACLIYDLTRRWLPVLYRAPGRRKAAA